MKTLLVLFLSFLSIATVASDDSVSITHTAEIHEALESGGTPVVVEVLGVVCDFCATAMNKVFAKQDEVIATYVDLDNKTLNLVLKKNFDLSDDQIVELVQQSGYRVAAIHR